MKKEEWLKRYRTRLIERGLTKSKAEEVLEAGVTDPYFLDDDPETAADDELSYWPSDS